MDGFKKFLLRGNLVELAVAVVIGAAFGTLVTSFVSSFVTPLIAAIGGQPDFNSLYFTVNGSKFTYGAFLNALISFALIAAVVYFFVVKPVASLLERFARAEEAKEHECPQCLSDIPLKATRCKFCTAEVQPAAAAAAAATAAPPAAPFVPGYGRRLSHVSGMFRRYWVIAAA